jgi:4a-hydroxytetrahydrobiopterin dehydratase
MRDKLTQQQIDQALASLDGWRYDGQRAITKAYRLKDHIRAMGFVNRIAMAAEVMNHHPELRVVYNNVEVALSTHDAGGVTQMDIDLAKKIEEYAE